MTGGQTGDYNATLWHTTDQLKLNCGQLSWSVGAKCGNDFGWVGVRVDRWTGGRTGDYNA